MKVATIALVLGVTLAGTASSVYASSISLSGGGLLQISNAGQPGNLSSSCFSFGAVSTCSSSGGVTTAAVSDPLFQSPGSGEIKDLSFSATTITDFLTVSSTIGTVDFDMTGFSAPSGLSSCTAVSTTPCLLPGTDVVLSPAGVGVVGVSFTILADAYTGLKLTGSTPYDGLFSTQLAGDLPNLQLMSIANLLAYLNNPTAGPVTTSWSATFSPTPTTPVPEPASMLLFGSGFGAAIVRLRRRKA